MANVQTWKRTVYWYCALWPCAPEVGTVLTALGIYILGYNVLTQF